MSGIYHWVTDELWKSFPHATSTGTWQLHLIAASYVVDLATHRSFTSPTIETADILFSETVVPIVAASVSPPHSGAMSLPPVTYTAPSSATDAAYVILTLDLGTYTRNRMVWYGDAATGLPITFDGSDRTVSGISLSIANKA